MGSERFRQIERLYLSAAARPADERAAFLADECAGDTALQAEIESLLAQPESAVNALEAPAVNAVSGLRDSSAAIVPGRIESGTTWGPYFVHSLLGRGGMGEVYRARDSKLGRDVAIKVLPALRAGDPHYFARFEREARVLASLNHPHIGAIYGFEEALGVHGLVLELVEGPTLADRVASGPLPVPEALTIARQIADALDAAHGAGIVHRDLKPANIKVTPAGVVKVLDFGLAKVAAGGPDHSRAPFEITGGTGQGMIVGTAAYMSPEQARGQPVDKRTDIWAFGCVLYELLTARAPFARETITGTIAAVVETDPDWSALPANLPSGVHTLLHRCLEKDPKGRLRDIGDARFELEAALFKSAHPSVATSTLGRVADVTQAKGETDRVRVKPVTTARRDSRRHVAAWAAASLILAAAVGAALWRLGTSSPSTPAPVSRIAISLPPGQVVVRGPAGPSIAVSPDGTWLAYAARQSGSQPQIYVRHLEGIDAKAIPGTEGGSGPFFSSDGQWVGFYADGTMKKVSTATGAVVTLAEGADARGASWGSQGTIVFAPTRTSVLHEVSDAGGSVRALTKFSATEGSHRWPEFLPGGRMLLFAALRSGGNWEQATIAVHSVDTGERRDLVDGGSHPRYTPSGHLVYVRGQTLMAAPFDIERLAVTAAGIPVVEGVMPSPPLSGMAQYSFSTTGALVYLPGSNKVFQRQLVWVNRNGTEQPLNAPPRPYRNPRIAPDGQRVTVAIEEQQMHVWVYDLARDGLTRLTTEGRMNYNPVWSADGQHIGFTAFGRPDQGFFRQRVDGSGALERLCCEAGDWPATSWSPDGQIAVGSGATGDLHVWRPGDRNVTPLARTPFVEGAGMFSPDGRWIAYASDESGRVEIYVRAYPGPGVRAQISTNGGTEPTWNRNGRELFYREGARMMSAPIAGGSNFSAGRPTILFEGQYEPSLVGYANYDVSPDGQRFLMLKAGAAAETEPTQINVVLNWFEDLKRRVVPN